MKNIFKGINFVLLGCLLLVVTTWTVTALQKQVEVDRQAQVSMIEAFKDKDIPCQNLDVLDSVNEILHWEIINDTLHIYTKKDSIRDERERWRYIDSLYKADEAYDKWMEGQ